MYLNCESYSSLVRTACAVVDEKCLGNCVTYKVHCMMLSRSIWWLQCCFHEAVYLQQTLRLSAALLWRECSWMQSPMLFFNCCWDDKQRLSENKHKMGSAQLLSWTRHSMDKSGRLRCLWSCSGFIQRVVTVTRPAGKIWPRFRACVGHKKCTL